MFDLTVSVFRAMFCARPFDVAKEMVRVTKRGGRVMMGNWIPNDPTSFVSQLLKISAAYLPRAAGGFESDDVGVESHIVERFGKAGVAKENILMVRDQVLFCFGGEGGGKVIEMFRRFYGPTVNAFERRRRVGGWGSCRSSFWNWRRSTIRAGGGTEVAATFMRVSVLRG